MVGHNGSLFTESFKAEGRYFIEITCVNCAKQWTPQNMHEIVEYFMGRGQVERAARVQEELDKEVKRETRPGRKELDTNWV